MVSQIRRTFSGVKRVPSRNPSFWPTAEQESLLRAAVLEGDAARQAYREWAARVDVDSLDYGSQRLLPLLYRNVQHLGLDSPHTGKFKGAYRRAFYQNAITLRNSVAVLRTLQGVGVGALVLKGVTMILLYYRDLGVRPMSDFDLLVHPEQARQAIQAVESTGWYRRSGPPFTEGFFTVHNSWPFRHPKGGELDLHWYLLEQSCFPDADADLWQAAIPAQLEGYSIRVLNATDQLLHVCIHGAAWDIVPALRWVADALAILRHSAERMDWNRLVMQAKKHCVVLPLHATLAYLRERFDAPVPEDALRELRVAPTTKQQRVEFRWRGSQPRLLQPFLNVWFGYLRDRHARPENARPQFLAFPGFLQRWWGTAHLWQVPLVGISRLAGELGIRRRPGSD